MAAASLAVRVSAQIAEFQKSFADMNRTVKTFSNEFQGMATRAAAVGAFIGTIAADIARSIARGLGNAVKDAVKFSSEFANSFIGLSSVARAFGTDADEATAAARRLSADGLLPVKDAATGLKNLLAAGFNLQQATQLMNAFKDSAAFGRQGALSFGDAIRSATEGVKNGNSILVDNAGITKNLSQILKEAGFSAQDLSRASSDAGVRMALFNGILREAAAQTGDAARLTQTYSGQVSRLETSYQTLLGTIGNAITQNATVATALGGVSDAISTLTTGLKDNGLAFELVSEAVIFTVKAFSFMARGVGIAISAVNALDTGFAVMARNVATDVQKVIDTFVQLVVVASKIPGSTLALAGMADEIATMGQASTTVNGVIASLNSRINDNVARVQKWAGAAEGFATKLDNLAKDLQKTRGQVVAFGKSGTSLNALDREFKGSSASIQKETKAIERALDSLRGKLRVGIQGEMPGLDVDIKRLRDLSLLLPSVLPPVDALTGAYKRNALAINQSVDSGRIFRRNQDEIRDVLEQAERSLRQQERALSDLGGAFANLGNAIGGDTGRMVSEIGRLIQQFDALQKITANLTSPQSTASWGQYAAAVFNWATLVITAFQLVADWMDRNDAAIAARANFITDQGGIDALRNRARTAGAEGELDLLLKNSSGIQRDLSRINRALQEGEERLRRYGLTWRDLGTEIRQSNINEMARTLMVDFRELQRQGVDALSVMGDALSNLVIEAIDTGTQIPASLQPIIEQLIRMGGLTEEAAAAMLGLREDTMPSLEDITAAAERYGLTLDQLGPKVQQLRINEAAAQIVKDFELLMAAGADSGVVMEAMQGKIQDIINTALDLGLEVPESMRPMLQKMVDAGLLTDSAGKKLEDLSQINFAEPLAKKIDLLIEKLTELVEKFNEVAAAAGGIAIPRPPSGAGGGTQPGGRGVPRDVNIQDPAGIQIGPAASISPDGTTQTINVTLDGDVLTRATVRGMPRELTLLGVR